MTQNDLHLIILGHPNPDSFGSALAHAYVEGIRESGGRAECLDLFAMKFDPILHKGYREIQPLEPDLIRAQELIRESRHLAFFYPQWWGSAPALLKGFVDRVFLPGFAFKYHPNNPLWDRLLKGRDAEIWMTSDAPRAWSWFMNRNSATHWLKEATLRFCGVKPVRLVSIDRARFLSDTERKAWIDRARAAGRKVGLR